MGFLEHYRKFNTYKKNENYRERNGTFCYAIANMGVLVRTRIMEWGFTNLRVFHLPVEKGANFLESLWESSERKLHKLKNKKKERKLHKKGIPDIHLINAIQN